MNYRHLYHAGNFADVFKHIVLVLLLDYLRQKDKPFFVLDTHAGIGVYDLQSEAAQKTHEADHGIGRLWARSDAPPAVAAWLASIRRLNAREGGRLRFYPGSPRLILDLLRRDDRLVANELHPEDHETLRAALGHDVRVRVENQDGYIALKALLPPPERRGLVLIDPPFEVRDEFDRLLRGLRDGYRRWATGMYILWYPIKDRDAVAQFHQSLAASGIPRILAADFLLRPDADAVKFNGCGMVIVNPPWTLREQLATLGPWLAAALDETGQARCILTELAGETDGGK